MNDGDIARRAPRLFICCFSRAFRRIVYYANKVIVVPSERRQGRKQVNHNIRYKKSVESTMDVTKGIENRVGAHSDCASLVVVSGGVPFASEYEGHVSA